MNRSLLTLGIVLTLGSAGCAGFGLQPTSSLGSVHRAERGVDGLWDAPIVAAPSATPPRYADQSLDDLWETEGAAPRGVVDPGYDHDRGADLWNPASVTRSWEPAVPGGRPAYRLSELSESLWY